MMDESNMRGGICEDRGSLELLHVAVLGHEIEEYYNEISRILVHLLYSRS